MNNFQKFKRKLKPEQVARFIGCSECPLYMNSCLGFCAITRYNANPLKVCTDKIITWFNQEAK